MKQGFLILVEPDKKSRIYYIVKSTFLDLKICLKSGTSESFPKSFDFAKMQQTETASPFVEFGLVLVPVVALCFFLLPLLLTNQICITSTLQRDREIFFSSIVAE